MAAIGRILRSLFWVALVLAPWFLFFPDHGRVHEGQLIHWREMFLDQLGRNGEQIAWKAFAIASILLVGTLAFGSELARRLFRRVPVVSNLYFDPRLNRIVLILLGLLFWFAAAIHWFEAPFSAPPLDPERVSYFAVNYAHAVWATIVYLLGGADTDDLRTPWGRATAITLLVVQVTVLSFFFAAYKDRLERRLRHHQLKDKPHGMRLRNHLVIHGASRLLKGLLSELDHAGFDRDVVVVAPDLDKNVFIGLAHLYPRLWAVRGSLEDEDAIRVADVASASRVILFPDVPQWAECPVASPLGEGPIDLGAMARVAMAVEATNPSARTCVYVPSPEGAAGSEAPEASRLLDLALRGSDWRLELPRERLLDAMTSRPHSIGFLIDLLAYEPLGDLVPHDRPELALYVVRWGRFLSIPWPLRILRSRVRRMAWSLQRLVAGLPGMHGCDQRIRVLGVVRPLPQAKGGDVRFLACAPRTLGAEDRVVVMSRHPPSPTEVAMAVADLPPAKAGERKESDLLAEVPKDPTVGREPQPPAGDEPDGLARSLALLNLAGEATPPVVLLDRRRDARHAMRKAYEIHFRRWLVGTARDVTARSLAERLMGLGFRRRMTRPARWIAFRAERRRLVAQLHGCDGLPSDHLVDRATILLLRHASSLEGNLPPWLLGRGIPAVASEHVANLLLAHHVVDGPAAKVWWNWLKDDRDAAPAGTTGSASRLLLFEWKGKDTTSFAPCQAELDGKGSLLGLKRIVGTGPDARVEVLGPWRITAAGHVVETEVKKGDVLFVASHDEPPAE